MLPLLWPLTCLPPGIGRRRPELNPGHLYIDTTTPTCANWTRRNIICTFVRTRLKGPKSGRAFVSRHTGQIGPRVVLFTEGNSGFSSTNRFGRGNRN
jgi:hypothetical protein